MTDLGRASPPAVSSEASLSAPAPWVPRKGEMVHALGELSGKEYIGEFFSLTPGGSAVVLAEGSSRYCRRDSLRPISSPAPKKFYNSMPPAAELPKVLPAGTRSAVSGTDIGGWVLDEGHTIGHPAYVPPGRVGSSPWQYADPRENVAWSTVEVQPSPPPSAKASCDRCGADPKGHGTLCFKCDQETQSGCESKKPDPYAEHRKLLRRALCLGNANDKTTEAYVAAQQYQDDSRIAASRKMSKLDQAKAQLVAKVEPRHASDWEVDDSPSNVYCNGRP